MYQNKNSQQWCSKTSPVKKYSWGKDCLVDKRVLISDVKYLYILERQMFENESTK